VALPGHWVGVPQALTIDIAGTTALLVNVHALPLLGGGDWDQVIHDREATAHTIAALATRAEPLIVTGDFNTTSLSAAYRTLTSALGDSWREAGWGFGGTFPGGTVTFGTPAGVTEVAVPMWVTRIDYVFHSRDWVAVSSQIGPWDGYSDHRPVIATLTLAASR
jgi:endonuclease/exonuclease/phosphatase (EEP) superfamily protein YafD